MTYRQRASRTTAYDAIAIGVVVPVKGSAKGVNNFRLTPTYANR